MVPDYRAEIPFRRGAEEIMAWYDEDEVRRRTDPKFDQLANDLVAGRAAAWPQSGHR
jgi:hypothetical protein